MSYCVKWNIFPHFSISVTSLFFFLLLYIEYSIFDATKIISTAWGSETLFLYCKLCVPVSNV